MPKYYLKHHVTSDMLKEVGFIAKDEGSYTAFTRDTGVYCDKQKRNETVLIFSDEREVYFNGDMLDLVLEDYIADLIEKGYLKVE